MELRSYSHLHFIQAIKGSLVMKTLNTSRGKPALTFKEVKEIYEAEDTEQRDSIPTIGSKDEYGCFQFNPNRVDSESLSLPLAERRVRVDTSEFNLSTSDEESNSDLDDISFVDMTLKQFKESCKARKRKCTKHVDSGEKTFENPFLLKQENTNFEPEEDGDDLMEPLSSWKSKITKNTKRKRKCIRNHMSTSSQSAMTIVKHEQVPTDQNFWQSSVNLAPIDIKVEDNEPDNFNFQIICDAADSSFGCNEQADYCGVVIDEAHVPASECVLETDMSTSLMKEQSCVINEVSYEYMEFANPESVSDFTVSGWEIMNVDIPKVISYQCPGFPVTEVENEGYIIQPLLDDVSPEPISISRDQNTNIFHYSQSHSSNHHLLWPSSSNRQIQVLDMAVANRFQCMEIIDGDGAYLLEDGTKDDLPYDLEASAISPVSDYGSSWSSNTCSSPSSCLVSVSVDPSLEEREQLFLPPCADAAVHPFDAADKVTTPSGLGDYHHPKLQCPPERLLSNRKAISPTSQERLCKAMNSIELNDDKHSECRGKLLFGKQTENKVITAKGCDKIRKAEVTINTKQVLRKPKYDKKGSHPRGVLKSPHLSSAAPSFGTGCTTTQNAIAFSQRQMQDIESLATKLTAELSYMKDLVQEMLYSEACPATSLKHGMDKVTMAVKSANKTEETAKRWLSIMARDCNRFCKIMKLTETESPASGHAVKKERKITFADEAGGKLCHVKLFKDDMASLLESTDIEK